MARGRRERSGLARWLRRGARLRRMATSQPALLAGLTVIAAGYTVGAVLLPTWVPAATISLWIMLGGFFLRLRYLIVYYIVLALALAAAVKLRDAAPPNPGVILTLILAGVLVLGYARGRERVGVQGNLGDSMLVDLRERLLAQSAIPPLGPGWPVETVLQSACGDSFSGDFLVASGSPDEAWLEIVLVDVSDKGQAAGTRSLLLSGAFGGLLGSLPREQCLVEANRYLLRQRWPEGFATAVHVAIDQATGTYELRCAGHPPAAHYHGGDGPWRVAESAQAPLLGVVSRPQFPVHVCTLHRQAGGCGRAGGRPGPGRLRRPDRGRRASGRGRRPGARPGHPRLSGSDLRG